MKNTKDTQIEIPIRGKALSVQELADLWDLKATTIRQYLLEGMPVFKQGGRGIANILSSEDCVRWREKRAVDAALLQFSGQKPANDPTNLDRLREIRIEKAELELSEARGDLVRIDDWVPLIEEVCVNSRRRFLAIPNLFRAEFPDIPRLGNVTRWLNAAIVAAVNSLADALKDVPEEVDNG